MTDALVDARGITISYRRVGPEPVVEGRSLSVARGQVVHVQGRSGTGKSSLLRVVAGMQAPQAGRVWLEGVELGTARPAERARLRREVVAYLAQDPPLIVEFDLVTNVALPALIARGHRREARRDALAWLQRLGVGARTGHRRAEVSGGELRRAAIARTLAVGSPLLVLDEPFADLDDANIDQVAEALTERVRSGTGILVASHVPLPMMLQAEVHTMEEPAAVVSTWR